MITKLRSVLNFKTGSERRNARLLTPMFIIILYLGGVSNINAFQTAPFSEANETLTYDFNECASFSNDNSPWEYSEFVATPSTSCSSISGGHIYRTTGKHSCTDDMHGNAGDAACFQSSTDNNYTANHTLAIRLDIELHAENGKSSRLDGISFKQLAPTNYKWSADGYSPTTGPNNYPTKFGIRVLKDGSEIYRLSDLGTTQSWYTSEFNFNHVEDFTVVAGTSSTFTFELFSYAPIGNGAAVSAWDLDDLKIFSSCEEDCNLTVDAGEDQSNCNLDEIILTANVANASDCSTITSSYKIIDSNTEVGCFTADPGVIFQKGDGCQGIDYVWRAGDDLILNEYDNDTATITGTVIDQNGRMATVNMELFDKENSGKTWNASCYLDGISGQETYYRSFIGAITVDGVAQSVGTRFNAHYILANGAGFDSNQYGLGAWTGGAFGECTEWFGNLVPQTIDNTSNEVNYVWSTADGNIITDSNQQTITVDKAGTYKVTAKDCEDCEAIDTVVVTELPGPTVDAGEDVEVCVDELVELTATAGDLSECPGGCVYPIETVSRCHDASNFSDVWLQNITNTNKGFVTSSSEFKTFDDGTATYTAIATNGIDNVDVNITFSGYTKIAPEQSPKENNCNTYDTSDWVYWTNTSGTIKTEQHGTLIVSRAGPSMQMGNGADVTREGFGASGWLTISGGDGFYTAGDVNIKLGDCDAFDAVSTVDYLWSTADGNIVGNVNQKTITVDKSGTYTVSVSDCEACAGSDSVDVNIVSPKAYVIEGGANFCIDGEADYLTDTIISISGEIEGANNTFVVTDSEGKILALPATFEAVKEIDFDGAGLGTCLLWNLSFEDGLQGAAVGNNANDLEGCFDLSLSVKIIRSEAPDANAGDDVAICKGDDAILTATGGASYLWSTGETTASITVSPTVNTVYSVTVKSDLGCEATDEVRVSLNPEVIADAGADVSICSGDEAMLTATGGGSYLWSTGETTASITVSPTAETVYTVTVTSAEGCEATDEVRVSLNPEVIADAGADVIICSGDEAMLTATGGGSYLWSTGETTASITVFPTVDTVYSVTVTSAEGCEATDEVMVDVADKVIIGDFVWLDENQNGLQDDGVTGINDVKVTLYECDGTEVASTMTADNASGAPGAYSFEVCPDSGYYYVVFDEVPELLDFTASNSGDDAQDSDANENGRTQCFNVENVDILTIDAGLIEKCDIKVDAGDDGEICEDEIVELTADILDDTAECPGGCVYPIKTQDRCYGPTGDFEVYLVSTGSVENFKFKASEQKFERLADGSVRYTATASNGKDVIEVDALLSGYTQIAPINSPKANECQQYDTSDWEYWTTWSGTITSRDHGVFNLSVKGAAFQMGIGADVVRTGFGASGWFYVDGGDGFYTDGDINVTLEECVEDNVSYKWTTENGNIVGDANQKTIRVDQPGTYTVEVVNCIDCYTTDSIKLVKGFCYLEMKQRNSKMTNVYPVPVQSGGTLTIEFDTTTDTSANNEEFKIVPLKGQVEHIQRKEDVSVILYNVLGQMITAPRSFKIENGKATIYLDLDYIPTGKYIVRAQGPTWSDAKNIIVE
mgnify:CR=1 FL=1